MKKVLITGAYGFLGRNTALKFQANGYKVYGCGHEHWQEGEKEEWGIDEWLADDIQVETLRKSAIKPDVIVHCAGSSSVAESITSPAQDFTRTVTGTLVVLEFIRLYSPKTKLIYPSSAAVYGEHSDTMINVNDPLEPVSPYGVHKKIVEELCASYHKFFNVNCVVIRFFSIYGPGLKKQLLWDACNKFLSAKDEVVFWGTGQETRDWIYITDATGLIFNGVKSPLPFLIMNGGSGIRYTISQTLLSLADNLDMERSKVIFNGTVRLGDPVFYCAELAQARQVDWEPKVLLSEGLKSYVEWYRYTEKN